MKAFRVRLKLLGSQNGDHHTPFVLLADSKTIGIRFRTHTAIIPL
jgi:hypothetical protein